MCCFFKPNKHLYVGTFLVRRIMIFALKIPRHKRKLKWCMEQWWLVLLHDFPPMFSEMSFFFLICPFLLKWSHRQAKEEGSSRSVLRGEAQGLTSAPCSGRLPRAGLPAPEGLHPGRWRCLPREGVRTPLTVLQREKGQLGGEAAWKLEKWGADRAGRVGPCVARLLQTEQWTGRAGFKV